MDTQKQFEKFYENIKLTKKQRNDAKTKYKGVCEKLHDYYYSDLEYSGKTKLLIGSYGKKTNIRPPRDVDVIFIMPADKFEQYNNHQSNGQSRLLQDIRNILNEKYTATNSIRAWGMVVLIEFSDGTHNVELLPAWEQDNGTFIIPNTKNNGSWDVWDYRRELDRIDKSNNETNGITRFLIRTLKKWTDNCTVKLNSFQIEDYVLAFLETQQTEGNSYSLLIKNVFSYIDNRSPVEAKSHIETAYTRAKKAYDFEQNEKMGEATTEWKKLFGDDFPKYEERSLSEVESDSVTALYPAPKEEFLERDYGIPIKINPSYKFKIDADVEQDKFRKHSLSYYIANKMWLMKKKKLTFAILKNDVPGTYSVKWKVRNFGSEAAEAGDLRGEITRDSGYEKKIENTKYFGKHFVECYIIQNGICVAMDSITVPIH